TSVDVLPVRGAVPPWLTGTLVRVGPAKFEVGGRAYNHWFDGLAMLHRFAFAAGRVCYANRHLRSRAYLEAAPTRKISPGAPRPPPVPAPPPPRRRPPTPTTPPAPGWRPGPPPCPARGRRSAPPRTPGRRSAGSTTPPGSRGKCRPPTRTTTAPAAATTTTC